MYFLKITQALWPPKPKVLLIAIFISLFWALLIVKFKDEFMFSSEFLWLIVGGTIPFLIDKMTEIASTAPAAPS